MTENKKLEMIAHKSFNSRDDFYEIVDFLNKNLSQYNLMFGLKKDGDDKMMITVYEV